MSRADTRNTLWTAGLLPALIAVAFAVKVVLMLGHEGDGAQAYAAERFGQAREDYSANRRLNVIERWVAPFDAGVSAFRDGDPDGAVDLYLEALTVVPEEHACMVRINLALAYEALGDRAAADGDPEAAVRHWLAGIATLEEGGCTDDAGSEELTDDAVAVDERLRSKLPPQEQPGPPPEDPPPPPPEPDSPQEQELEQRNSRGEDLRRETEEFEDYSDLKPDYAW